MSSQYLYTTARLVKELYPILAVVNIFLIYATSPSIVFQITTTQNFGFLCFVCYLLYSGIQKCHRCTTVVYIGHRLFQKRRELLHSVAQNSTVGRKLWLWDYGYGGRGQHSLELSVLIYLAFYSESFYTIRTAQNTHHLHCRDVFTRKGVCCVTDQKACLTNSPTERQKTTVKYSEHLIPHGNLDVMRQKQRKVKRLAVGDFLYFHLINLNSLVSQIIHNTKHIDSESKTAKKHFRIIVIVLLYIVRRRKVQSIEEKTTIKILNNTDHQA